MANLTYKEITREGKEYRTELLVEKVFSRNGKSNHFVTDNGILVANQLKINNKNINSGDTIDLVGKIFSLKLSAVSQRNFHIGGKLQGQNSVTFIPVNKLQKTEEFGGQPAGGTRVNKGIKFEKDFYKVLNEQLSGEMSSKKYSREVDHILQECAKKEGSPVVGVEDDGGKNQSRPIAVQGGQLYISPNNHKKHGEKLTDLTLIHANDAKSFLSLKFSSTLTFMNAGVGQIFTRKDMENGKITTNIGKQIIETFGLDETEFCEVFTQYGKKKFSSTKVSMNNNKLKKFLQTCIGSNYWMVHGMEGGKVYFWEMSSTKNPQYASITGDVEVQYGGKSGSGKRIDIVFSNQYFDFKVNIRNKQGGLYPSHIMCDYKSKSATGKKLL
jgi:hypothetical protein